MGYANPIECMGLEKFVEQASSSGMDSVLIVDHPSEESIHFVSLMKSRNMDVIFHLASTSSETRIKQIGKMATGYIYYVSLNGVARSENLNMLRIKKIHFYTCKYRF